MNFQFSIVTICKNEAGRIEQALSSVLGLSDDIVVYDSGSTDGTLEIVRKMPVNLHSGSWEGFGKTRQKAVALARYDWVLIVDADEILSNELAEELKNLVLTERVAYSIRLQNHLGNKHIRWGSWGNDFRVRLYNKNLVEWNDLIVHEKLVIPSDMPVRKLEQPIRHYTAKSIEDLSAKMQQYALLTAAQYHGKGKTSTWVKRQFGPLFAFIKSFFLKLGFVDGADGYRLAKELAAYTALKYKRLQELNGIRD